MFFNDLNEKIVYVGSTESVEMMFCQLAGITYPNPDYRIVRFPSTSYVFEYVISGKGYIECNGEKIPVTGGTFYCFRKGAELMYYADRDDPYEKIWINLDGNLPGKLFDFFLVDDVYVTQANVLDLFFAMHDRLEHVTEANFAEHYAEVLNLLFSILNAATREWFFPTVPTHNTLDDRIRTFIDKNIYSDLSLDRISEEFGITKMHIIRVFKAKFHITPMQYLINRKISVAKSLLTSTVMPIKEIASLLRYSNTQHFSSSFRSAVGCTPNQYRQLGRKDAASSAPDSASKDRQ